jgi:SAM-dependent methyltransferase
MTVRFRVPEMEGRTAIWYARQRGTESQLRLVREQAAALSEGLPAGAEILEVAPGPGYFAVELARRAYTVTGLDISHTMVQIATEHARRSGVVVEFRHGDATAMPFEPTGSTSSCARRRSRTSWTRCAPSTRCTGCCGPAGLP